MLFRMKGTNRVSRLCSCLCSCLCMIMNTCGVFSTVFWMTLKNADWLCIIKIILNDCLWLKQMLNVCVQYNNNEPLLDVCVWLLTNAECFWKIVASVSDPYSSNPDPDPAKNLNPDPERPWIRIRILAISLHYLKKKLKLLHFYKFLSPKEVN